ncbi:MAG: PAS domain S-box protein [Desulfobacterales bacterium]|nr:PAS domain S-box protein [Desulfobacterales bacterium]MDJ0884000.1 PAS domain S-box protein [Desulfobacterales bacterium]
MDLTNHPYKAAALKIALIYAGLSAAWILFSDQIVLALVRDAAIITWIQMVKGWLFVVGTAGLIYYLLRRELAAYQRAREELAESEVRFHTLIEQAADAIFVSDLDGRILDANWQACEGLQYTREALLGRNIADIDADLATPADAQHFLNQIVAGVPDTHARRFTGADGKPFPVELRISRIAMGDRQLVLGLARDISARLAAEAQLSQLQALLQAAIEQSPAGIIIADAPDATIRIANSAALGIRGETDIPLTNIPVALHPQNWQTFHPDGRPYAPEDLPLSQAVLHGRTIRNQDVIIRQPDGRERWVLGNAAPVRDQNGNVLAGVVVFPDITERKRVEQTLQKYEHIVSTSRDLLALADRHYVFQAVSQSYVDYFGRTREEVLGHTVGEVIGEEHFQMVAKPYVDRCLAGEEIQYQTWVPLANNRKKYFDIRYYPHYEKGRNRISGYVISGRDLTDYKTMEDQLRQSSKMEAIGTLAGGIAHDFNNILAAIMGYADLVVTRGDTDDETARYVDKIRQAGKRAADLIKQILTFSRQGEQKARPLRIQPVIKEALKLLRASLPATVRIETDLRSGRLIMADPTQLHQIVMNLCTNAAHAMRDTGGQLTVTTRDTTLGEDFLRRYPDARPGDNVCLSVADTGLGIQAEIMNRIFDPFFTTKPKEEGTGMGLALVHGIVKSAGGVITVESTPGQGTRFEIYFPAVAHDAADRREEDLAPLPTGRESILFVDDEEILVELGQRMLEQLGYRVTPVASSVEALRRFQDDPGAFDLVITDLTMPNMAGDKLAAELLRIRPDIPIIMATGFSEKFTAQELEMIGIRKLVFKPMVMRDIATVIREVMGGD